MERRDRPNRRQRAQQPAATPVRKRRVSRAEREAKRQRQLYIGVAIAGALVVSILAYGAINEYFIKPREVLATVNGVNIRRRDYWKVRNYELVQQIGQYQQLAQIYGGEQGQQYQAFAQQSAQELTEVWGSTAVNESTLQRMVEDQVYLQNAAELGVTITEQDVDTWIHQQFEPSNAPLISPTPSPTFIPTRAAWATETAVAGATQTAEAQATETAAANAAALAATPIADTGGTPSASPVASPVGSPETPSNTVSAVTDATPAAATPDTTAPDLVAAPESSPVGSPAATPEASPNASPAASPEGSPVASPIASPEAGTPTEAPTPNPTQAIETAEAGFQQFQDNVFDDTHMSEADYVRLIARPSVTREHVQAVIESQVGQTAEQVHAAHILVSTSDLARSIRDQLNQPGAVFEDIARQQSSDTSTAPNGGDLGWFTRNMMVKPFADVAFDQLTPGQISEPFETEFGWHIVLVYDHQNDRPMTDAQIDAEKKARLDLWVQEQLAQTEVESDHLKPTETPAPGSQTFEPPPDAPPTPTPSPPPLASPIASPVASPEASPVASPVASDGTPNAEASPIDSVATPAEAATPTAVASPAA
jgi:parvulin-like peptidyl-prolyl isomerase